jgi:DNA-binding transcriptional ArsR family regulator
MPEIIKPQKNVAVRFQLEPAANIIGSLSLLDMAEDFSGLNQWVYETKAALSEEQVRTNRLVLQDAYLFIKDFPAASFPAWVDHLADHDPTALRDQALEAWLREVRYKLSEAVPTPSELLSDRWTYLALAERYLHRQGQTFETWYWEKIHNLLKDPEVRQGLIVNHLRFMWDEHLKPEWERNLSMLEESINAFESLNLSGLTAAEALKQVALRSEIPQQSEGWLAGLDQIVFIPSPHTGPYLIQMSEHTDTQARFLYGARIPEGAASRMPSLTRSELLMRLTALSNDTRLRILELLAQKGELSTPEIINQLDLSQSAASRHLEHLTATGYLNSQVHQGANHYQVNLERLDDTFKALKAFFS